MPIATLWRFVVVSISLLLVTATVSVLWVRFYRERIKVRYGCEPDDPVDVPVAARDIRRGEVVTALDVAMKRFTHRTMDAFQGSHYPASETLRLDGKVVVAFRFEGRVVVAPIRRGQVIQSYHFADAP